MTDLSAWRPPPSLRTWSGCGRYVRRMTRPDVMSQFRPWAAEFLAVVTEEKAPQADGDTMRPVAPPLHATAMRVHRLIAATNEPIRRVLAGSDRAVPVQLVRVMAQSAPRLRIISRKNRTGTRWCCPGSLSPARTRTS